MIALDTNVVVRLLVDDHAEQAQAARALMDGLSAENPGFICREVVVEVVWVLERFYKVPRAQVAAVLAELITTDNLVVEAADDVANALPTYRRGGADLSDLMILAAARSQFAPLYTFDRQLARQEGAILLKNPGHPDRTWNDTA